MNNKDTEAPERYWVELRTQHAFEVRPDPHVETVEYLRHPRYTHKDDQRLQELFDSLPDIPTEEQAEEVLQACGTSGKEVVNGFIDRLLRENLEMKQKLDRVDPPAAPTGALTQAERDQIGRAIAESDIAGCELENSDIDALVDLFEGWLERRVVAVPTAPPAPDEADQTLERQTRKMAKKEASQADTIILHQATDGHYHWFCRNCKSERLGISRETVLSDYLPNVTCANCGFQFGVDKRYLSSTKPPAVSEPSALALPEWSDCEAAVDEKTAMPLQEFIYEYEPGNNDKEWRARLTAALAQARKEGAQETWKDAITEICVDCAEGDTPTLDTQARWYYHGEGQYQVGCSASKLRLRRLARFALQSASKVGKPE